MHSSAHLCGTLSESCRKLWAAVGDSLFSPRFCTRLHCSSCTLHSKANSCIRCHTCLCCLNYTLRCCFFNANTCVWCSLCLLCHYILSRHWPSLDSIKEAAIRAIINRAVSDDQTSVCALVYWPSPESIKTCLEGYIMLLDSRRMLFLVQDPNVGVTS